MRLGGLVILDAPPISPVQWRSGGTSVAHHFSTGQEEGLQVPTHRRRRTRRTHLGLQRIAGSCVLIPSTHIQMITVIILSPLRAQPRYNARRRPLSAILTSFSTTSQWPIWPPWCRSCSVLRCVVVDNVLGAAATSVAWSAGGPAGWP